ncbi:tetratricopeptide repeat protein [Nannocystaceae bacterium ST9]
MSSSSESIDSTRVVTVTGGTTLDSQPNESSLWRTLTRGRQLGRYVMLRRLARGGMGEVWLAWDPELDRDVAIKLLRSNAGDVRAGARLLREARAMARLAHPNIVGVYDVGAVEGQVFVAMEFVRGETLAQWAKQDRPWRQVVDVYLAAGRGLAAAHAADMVHRDFKPDNAMIDEHGRVRVMDFGLAYALGPGPETESQHDFDTKAVTGESLALTRTGALLGTPAYMAPEQFRLETAGPAADQFAFCIALWEAIYRQRPFAGPTLQALSQQVQGGKRRTVPKHVRVPARVRRVIERGLDPSPERRWPSMNALLVALARARTPRVGVGLAVAGLLSAGVIVGLLARTDPPSDSCRASELSSAALWSDAAREQIASGLLASGRPHARETARRVTIELDAWVARWTEVARDACLERDELPSELRVGQAVCLARLEHTLVATLDVLGHADEEVADRAIELVAGLPDPTRCADARVLASASPAPEDPELAREVEAIHAALDELVVLRDVGRVEPAHERSLALVERARASGHDPTIGEVLAVHGSIQAKRGEYEPASESQREAFHALIVAGAFEAAGRVADDLVFTTGVKLRRFEVARTWALQAEALLEHVEAGPEFEVDHLAVLGALTDAEGDYAGAIAVYRRALELAERLAEPDPLRLGHLHEDLGISQSRLDHLDEAEREQALAIELFERQLGGEHPTLGSAWLNLGNTRYMQGEREQAKAAFERALAIYRASLGPEHPFVGSALTGLGAVQLGEGDDQGAFASFSRALELAEARLGPEHLDIVPPLNNLGIVQARLGDLDAAEASARRALALLERANGSDHPDLLATLDTLASLLARKGDHLAAKQVFERSLRIGEASLGSEHPDLSYALLGLGSAALALGEPAQAEPYFRRMLALVDAAEGYASMAAQAEFGLARIAQVRGDRAGARTLALAARERLSAAPEGEADTLAQIAAMIDELGERR